MFFGGWKFRLSWKIFTSFIDNVESSSLPIQEKCTPVLLLTLPHFISDHQVCGVFFCTSSHSLWHQLGVCVCAWAHMLSRSVEPDSLWSLGLQPTRLLCPWVFQVRTLEWIAIISSWGYCQPRNWTCICFHISKQSKDSHRALGRLKKKKKSSLSTNEKWPLITR